jgi:hypothetical protein
MNRPIPEDGPCSELLLQCSADGQLKPIKTFLYHHFHNYLTGLLSRPDWEALMDRPCDDLLASIGSPPHIIRDVWDVNYFRTFDSFADDVIPVAKPSTMQDSQLSGVDTPIKQDSSTLVPFTTLMRC